MKIKLLIDSKALGGVETHVMNLSSGLKGLSHDCQIVFMRTYKNNVLYDVCKERGLDFVTPSSYSALFSYLKKEKPDIIHAHGYKANIFARFFGLMSRSAIISTFHTGEKPVGRVIAYNFLDKLTSFLSNNICVNTIIANSLPSKSVVIPNFVDIPETPNAIKTNHPFQIYFIGRVSSEKGPLRFCELSEKSPNIFSWHMVGSGPLLALCQENHPKTVHYHGAVVHMETIWPKVDLLAITSTYEGLPLVLLEAMSRGIPVVAFNVGSIQEVMGDTDYLIDNFDIYQMQSVICDHFLKPMTERQKMALDARNKIIASYSVAIVVPQIESFYKHCLKGLPQGIE